jgi:hypothetical protein
MSSTKKAKTQLSRAYNSSAMAAVAATAAEVEAATAVEAATTAAGATAAEAAITAAAVASASSLAAAAAAAVVAATLEAIGVGLTACGPGALTTMATSSPGPWQGVIRF